ncbi:MAG: WecB/TagA/CpsF family glycosyltransferase [Armatimonadetes bacterium]|nr:WecB/TagA/CpsF family glycosyltransferase [Armatimonadota bacterium]
MAELPPRNSITLHGMRIDRVTMEGALAYIASFIASGKPHHIVTADASMVMTYREDKDFAALVEQAALITPDGAGIIWASKRLGVPITAKVSGVDLSAKLVELSGKNGWRIFFFGGAPGIAEAAAQKMRERFPDANICGMRDGYYKADEEDTVAEQIAATKPDILLVAMGIPRQEKFIQRQKGRVGAKVYIGVGGTLDVFSGTVKRAPVWMQKSGLEWLYRISSSPNAARMKKLAALPQFARLTLTTQTKK